MSVSRLFCKVPGVPPGWDLERVGWPEPGEYYVTQSGTQVAHEGTQLEHPVAIVQNTGDYFYIRGTYKNKQYVGRKARFRDSPHEEWKTGVLGDFRAHYPKKYKREEDGFWYKHCQIAN